MAAKRTAPQLARLLVDLIDSYERYDTSDLWGAANEVRRVCSFGVPLATLIVKGFVNSASAEGRDTMEGTLAFLLTLTPVDRVNLLEKHGVTRAEWQKAKDDTDDTAAWWAAYGEKLDALRAPTAEQPAGRASTSALEGQARDVADIAVTQLRAERAAKRAAVPA